MRSWAQSQGVNTSVFLSVWPQQGQRHGLSRPGLQQKHGAWLHLDNGVQVGGGCARCPRPLCASSSSGSPGAGFSFLDRAHTDSFLSSSTLGGEPWPGAQSWCPLLS